MSSWVGGRRPQLNPNGGVKPHRPFRRAPYPLREERKDDLKDPESYEELDHQHNFPALSEYERYHQHQQNAPPADKRSALYQRFYKHIQTEKRRADCVVLSVSNQNTDYPKSIGHCLQERGLLVEMLYLQAESGLTRALQDVRSDGSPLCILVEQTNVALSSCTVIIFSESLKIHRNMPKDQAMDFVLEEYGGSLPERRDADPAEVASRAAELADDYLEREKLERYAVPSDTRHLLVLLSEGLHLYPDELATVSEYLHSRREHLQGASSEGENSSRPERRKILPPGLGKPPPLLPTPTGPHARERPVPPQGPMGEHPSGPLLATPGSYPKTKPPPLLSMHSRQGPSHGPPPPRGPPSAHGPPPRGPLHHHAPPRGSPISQSGLMSSHGPRGAPPSLKSLHLGNQTGLLPCPGAPPPRMNAPRR